MVSYCFFAGFAIIALKAWLVTASRLMSEQKLSALHVIGHIGYLRTFFTASFYVASFIFYLFILKRTSLSVLLPMQLLILTTLGAFYDARSSKTAPHLQFYLGILIVMMGFTLVVKYLPK